MIEPIKEIERCRHLSKEEILFPFDNKGCLLSNKKKECANGILQDVHRIVQHNNQEKTD